jgi:hypothetical protein
VVRILDMVGYTARQERLVVLVAVHWATRRRPLTASSQRLRMVIAHVRLRVFGCLGSWFRLAPIVAIPWASGSGVKVARGESPRGARSARNLDAAEHARTIALRSEHAPDSGLR